MIDYLVFAWRLLLLVSIFAFPHLFGILLYFRLSRAPRWLAALAASLAPAVLFLFLAPILLFAGIREAYANGDRCGMPALGAYLLLLGGTAVQFVLGLFTLLALAPKRRRSSQETTHDFIS